MMIKDIMTKDVITVKEDDTVEKCANLLSTNELSGLPVVDAENHVTGMITEGDLIKHNSKVQVPAFLEILGGIIYLDNPNTYLENVKKSMGHFVKTVMTEDVTSIHSDQNVDEAASLLVRNKVNRLPVLDKDDKLVGIVSRRDVMNHLFKGE
ncbi:MAG TPA: CBS domain-containing protein [Candidatus Avamphibacillus intestinigallinarum]|nr:CBS domain-containing protein [Candidatus Avamphibacillus intestinigallinarum]